MKIPCVKECPERSKYCHKDCQKYKKYVEWNEKRRNTLNKERCDTYDILKIVSKEQYTAYGRKKK